MVEVARELLPGVVLGVAAFAQAMAAQVEQHHLVVPAQRLPKHAVAAGGQSVAMADNQAHARGRVGEHLGSELHAVVGGDAHDRHGASCAGTNLSQWMSLCITPRRSSKAVALSTITGGPHR